MSMTIGDLNATSGMTKAIYDQLEKLIKPDLGDLSAQDLKTIQKSWRKLALAVATGVIDHITANMEIKSIETDGKVTTTIVGKTGGTADPIDPNHKHSVDLTGEAAHVVFKQVAGTGHVE